MKKIAENSYGYKSNVLPPNLNNIRRRVVSEFQYISVNCNIIKAYRW